MTILPYPTLLLRVQTNAALRISVEEGPESTRLLNWVLERVLEQETDGTYLAAIGAIEREFDLIEGTPRIRCRSTYRGAARRVNFITHHYTPLHIVTRIFKMLFLGLFYNNSTVSLLSWRSFQVQVELNSPKRSFKVANEGNCIIFHLIVAVSFEFKYTCQFLGPMSLGYNTWASQFNCN